MDLFQHIRAFARSSRSALRCQTPPVQLFASTEVIAHMDLVVILFGWPSLVTALILSALGLWQRKPILIGIGAVLTIPVALYLSASPAYPLFGLVGPLALGLATWACARDLRWLAIAGQAAYISFVAFLLFLVVDGPPR